MKEFTEYFRDLRTRQGMTNVALAERARVPASLISDLQNGRRAVGELQATRIGRALGLDTLELRGFVLRAVSGSTRKVLAENAGYPAEIINAAPAALRAARVSPDRVSAAWEADRGVEVVLVDGTRTLLLTTLELAA